MRNFPPVSIRRRLLVASLACFVLVAGCHWFRYYDLLTTHVELMRGMATDTAEALEAGLYEPRASDVERLRYPLLRGRQFAEVSADWDGTEQSGRTFRGFLDSYGAFVEIVDRARFDGVTAEEERGILESVAEVDRDASKVSACIECERDENEERCRECSTVESAGAASRTRLLILSQVLQSEPSPEQASQRP